MTYSEGVKALKTNNMFILTGEDLFFRSLFLRQARALNKEYTSGSAKELRITQGLRIQPRIYHITEAKNSEIRDIDYSSLKHDDLLIIEGSNLESQNSFIYVSCSKPKSWEEKDIVISVASNFFKNRNIQYESEVLDYIYQVMGYNLFQVITELNKLILYKENNISLEEAKRVITNNYSYELYDFYRSLINKDKATSLKILEIYNSKNSLVPLIMTSYRQLEQAVLIKEDKHSDLSSTLGLPGFIINRIEKEVQNVTTEYLKKLMNCFVIIIEKNNFISLNFYLEKMILEL